MKEDAPARKSCGHGSQSLIQIKMAGQSKRYVSAVSQEMLGWRDNLGEYDMTRIAFMIVALVAGGLLFGARPAQAHCDALDGPVAKAVQKALDNGNVNPVLAYAPATAEPEIRAAFEKSRKVRGLGADARSLADQAFMETVIRLHRAGEGAAYTGLAAEHAVETGDLAKLKAVLVEEIEHALRERIAHVRELQSASLEPETAAEVPDARARVSAELGFITFAETVRRAVRGEGAERHVD
jgi:hypothetical protein